MAEALAFALVAEVGKKLASTTGGWLASKFGEEWKLLESFEEDLESMKSTFTAIQAVLEDAENRCIMPDSSQLRDWLKKLKDAAEDVSDFLGEIETEEAAEQREEHQNRCVKKVRSYLCLCNPVKQKSNHDMAQKMRSLRNRLDEIAEEKGKFQLLSGTAISDRWKEFQKDRETFSEVDESKIVGRDDDKENIIKLVLDMGKDEEENVSVIPVVGMGGLGKTTLAQAVFNDRRVKETGKHFDLRGGHFDLPIWVCVSDDFSSEAIGRKILSDTNETCGDHMCLQVIAKRVVEKLEGQRFLLVLDDVWNEDQDTWDKVKVLFRKGKRGSKILVTTRSGKAAEIMRTISKPYFLKHLSDDDCWALFKRKAFKEGEERSCSSLEKIGREIVGKCGGVPLAAIALGSMMRHQRTDAEWEAVRDSEIWKLKDDKILPSLRLSYIQMPSALKHCFAYCSIFPKDHDIYKDYLINQWIALGFISTELIGSQYFSDLLSMSFLQELRVDWRTDILVCKMHDLVHDLAQSVAGDEVWIVEGDQAIKPSGGCRYLSLIRFRNRELSKPEIPVVVTRKVRALHLQDAAFPRVLSDEANSLRVLHLHTTDFLDSFKGSKQLRYLYFSARRMREVPESLFGLYNLQSLSLSKCESLESLPDSIARLQSLQYLDLSVCESLRQLPNSIGNLQSLRTLNLSSCHQLAALPPSTTDLLNLEKLDIRHCRRIAELPQQMQKMTKLRHLLNEGLDLCKMPRGIGTLTSLLALQRFVVCEQGSREYASIAELQHLDHLTGQLEIRRLENVEHPEEAMSANLKAKHKLRSLTLHWDGRGSRDEEVLQRLQPHPSLEALTIEGYMGDKYPSWMINGNLIDITLQSCHRLPPLGRLPYLKTLELDKIDVRQMGSEFCGGNNWATPFPALEELWLRYMTNLEEWLTTVTVDDKKGSRQVSAYPRLAKLEICASKNLRPQPCLPTSLVDLDIIDGTAELMERLLGPSSSAPSSSRGKQVLIDEGNTESDEWKGPNPLANDNSCELTSPPDSTPRLPNLQRLNIAWCEDLVILPEWLGDLRSLKLVDIYDCPSLASLPRGLQRLEVQLDIKKCPALLRDKRQEREEILPDTSRDSD